MEADRTPSAAQSQDILLREYQAEIKRLREAYERVRAQRDEALAQAERANHLAWDYKNALVPDE